MAPKLNFAALPLNDLESVSGGMSLHLTKTYLQMQGHGANALVAGNPFGQPSPFAGTPGNFGPTVLPQANVAHAPVQQVQQVPVQQVVAHPQTVAVPTTSHSSIANQQAGLMLGVFAAGLLRSFAHRPSSTDDRRSRRTSGADRYRRYNDTHRDTDRGTWDNAYSHAPSTSYDNHGPAAQTHTASAASQFSGFNGGQSQQARDNALGRDAMRIAHQQEGQLAHDPMYQSALNANDVALRQANETAQNNALGYDAMRTAAQEQGHMMSDPMYASQVQQSEIARSTPTTAGTTANGSVVQDDSSGVDQAVLNQQLPMPDAPPPVTSADFLQQQVAQPPAAPAVVDDMGGMPGGASGYVDSPIPTDVPETSFA